MRAHQLSISVLQIKHPLVQVADLGFFVLPLLNKPGDQSD